MAYQVPQTLPHVLCNEDKLYEGNLVSYARIIFLHAQNLNHPYHNFRHMFHVLWLCHEACRYYREVVQQPISRRAARNLLIAALFHDFNHSGLMGDDDLNVERALRGLRKHILEMDKPSLGDIESAIRGTQYPYVVQPQDLDLCGLILRDADVSQAFSVAWLQQVIFGLAAEWNMKPIEVLKLQEPFHRKLVFQTDWGRHQFPQVAVDSKIREAQDLVGLLEMKVA